MIPGEDEKREAKSLKFLDARILKTPPIAVAQVLKEVARMGDLARHIAETARRTYPQSPLTDDAKQLFTEMQEFLTMTADRMVAMLQDRNTAIAEQVIVDDDKLDALHQKTFDLMLSDEWQGTKQQLIDLVLLGRYMERLGDHAVSAARRVVFIVSGFDPSKEPSRDEDGSVY